MEIKQIDVLIKDIIGNDQENLSSELTKWLDFSKDKWAARLVLVQLYLLGEKLNDFTAIQVSDMIYKGTSELPSLLEILAVTNWTNHLNGRLENQLMEDSTFIKGQAGARNIPNELASKKIFLQPNGKNLEFTPIGKNLVKALFTLCLKNSGINLSTLVKILSQKSIEKDLLHAILLPELDIPTGLNLKLLEIQKNDEKITYFASSITQEIVEFILDHPYLDSSSTIQIKEHFQEILIRNYWNYLKYQPPELYQSKNKPVGLELNKIFPIHWIYQLKPREYKYPAELKWMFRNKNDYDVNSDPKLSFKTIILEAGPGTGKSVWMLQQTEKILSDLKESPFIFQLKDFSLLQKDQIKWLSFKDALIVSLSDDLSNPKEIMYTLLNCVNDENASIFWIKTYMKILQSTHFFLLLDGWDELEPNLKPFFLKLIQYIETQPIFKFTIIISTRFLDNELLSLKQDPPKTELENYFPKNSNIYSLNEPEIPQSIQYLQNKGVKTIVDQKSLEKLKKMLGDKLTPMDLWILGLFPKIEDLPSNRAQLFDRWIKYEILLEYQEKMQGPLGEITNILELDKFLNSEIFIERTADKSSFSLIQLVEGPVCSVTPKTDKEDYALSILLPRLVYNRIQNADYTYNYDRIIQANPLFRRFLHKVMDKNFHPNFRLQNPHYDYYLSACHCFNIYLAGNNFKFLDKPEMETFFREILVNNKKRRDRDLIHNFSDEYILLRNKMEIIPAFNPESIGYPINQAGPIIFETDMNNFIDPFKDQLYKFYWEKYTQFSDDLSNDELVTNFKNVSLSLTNRIDSIFDVIGDILTFQHKNYEQKKPLNDYIKKIELETPFIIPIIIHAFRFSENDYISREWIEKLEQHPFMDYPWIKLWIFREIIQWAPNRICDLAVYAKEHTYSYILKFCCCNIIPPQIPGIEEQNFSLSIDLFQKIQKTRYKEIILFHWASHYLTDAQLKTLQKLEAEIYEKESFQLDFKYLLILHGIMPKSFYFSDLNKITPQKCYQFLLALFWLQKNSLKPIQFELKDSNKTNILYLHQFCLEKSEKDLDDYEKKEEFFPPDFQKIIIEQCQNWWKEHMPCSHSALEEYFEHIGKILKNSSIFSKRNENLNELFTLKQYFIRFSQFEIQDRNIVFDLGKELIQKLLQEEMTDKSHHFEKTQLNEFLEIFLEWVLKCQTSSEFVDVLILFNNHPLKTIEKFILKGLSAYPNDWGIKNDIQTRIRSNFSEYVNEPHWNKHRKDHPKDLDENFSIGKKSSLIRFIPVVEAINLLTTHYNFSNFNPAHFNFLSSDEDDDEDEKNKTPSLENLFYFVHNLAVLEKPEAYKTIAQFWDRLYVNYTCYASQDPSFFIWCGIPYEKLEEVYQYLTNPIAKIFYLVCLSISDRYKPKKLDIKHSNFDTGSFIRNLIQEFPSTQIKQTLVEFLSADWTLDYYEFLFYFTEFDLDLASLILARVSDGKFKLSRILFQTKKNSIEQKRYNFLENYFDRFQPMIIDYLKQFMTIASQYVKKEILNVLISSQNQDAIRLASDWWENYDIIMKFPISIEKFFEIFQSVNNCVFLEKFVSVHGEFFFVHSYITPKAKLNACFKNLNTLYVYFCQKLITHNIINFKPRNDDLSRQIEEFYRRYYKIRREWHIFNTTQMRFYEILKTASGRKINDLISTRFPFFNRNYGDLSSLNLKLNELTKLTIDFQNTPEIMEILKKKNRRL